jgi:predicted Zn-dependent peptidase
MPHTRLPRALPLIFSALTFALSGNAQGSFQEVQSHITEFQLANGMKFIVLERHQAPVASFYTYANVGSVQEDTGATGLAHMFEHMAFKGTSTIGTKNYAEEKLSLDRVDAAFFALQKERDKGAKADPATLKRLTEEFKAAQESAGKFVVPNEFGTAIDRAGGRGLNASTSWDKTDYFYSLPSNSAELWFFLESERFRDPVFREFYKERDVVMEERRMRTESSPIGKLVEDFLASAYKTHAYGKPVVGNMSDLQNITRPEANA